MYTVIYYHIGKVREYKQGFPTRGAAWRWVESIINEIDYYQIIEE